MAKLENVKVLDMVNGEITRIEYEGDIYSRVEGGKSDLRIIDEEPEKFKVGDYVKVVGPTIYGNIKEGTITKITLPINYDGEYLIELLVESDYDYDYAKPHNLEKVEITSRELSFLNAGREINEYKVGDIVRVLSSPVAHPEQSIIEIAVVRLDGILAKGYDDDTGGVEEYWYNEEDFELIAPAESRVDNKGDGEDA